MATDVSDASFEREVLKRSESVLVLVHLLAPWSESCEILGSVLEGAVRETRGAATLVSVKVFENSAIAAALQIETVPSVYAIRNRRAIDGFIGALPGHEVHTWVARVASGLSRFE